MIKRAILKDVLMIKILLPCITVLLLSFYYGVIAQEAVVYVSPLGSNEQRGFTPAEPLKDIQEALDRIPRLREEGYDSIRICLLEGTYRIDQSVRIRPEHSGTRDNPVLVYARLGEEVILSGGRELSGWEVTADGLWSVHIPEVASGEWYFKQIYINGESRRRARIPNEGFKIVAGFPEGTPNTVSYHKDCQSFEFSPGDLVPGWKNEVDIDVIVYHFWTDSHLKIELIDTVAHIVTFRHKAGKVFTDDFTEDGARYIIENVWEGLDAPGEWYLDRPSGVLYYYPYPGEDPGSVTCVAPYTEQLLDIRGEQRALNYVEGIRFENLVFEYTNFLLSEGSTNDDQGASEVSAAVVLEGSRRVVLSRCEFRNLGNWAIEMGSGSYENRIESNRIHHVAAGGIRVHGGDEGSHPLDRTGFIRITDNEIGYYGQVYPSAVGIFLKQSYSNEVLHNHVHNGYYTGISLGWEWGYQRSISRDNKIEYNHIHDIGMGLLSDMGGIYTLGVSPGTTIRNNLIHDVEANRYGGWGIYNDEGSSHILVENNIVYRTKFAGYNVNSAREITVRNNIFALGRLNQISRNRMEPHKSFYFEQNIVYWTEGDLLDGRMGDESYMFYFRPGSRRGSREVTSTYEMDYNLYFNPNQALENMDFDGSGLAGWQERGKDNHSMFTDPLFEDAEGYDFRLKPGSPAFGLGFKAINMENVGPRYGTGRYPKK